jgi:CheY-like chemotaxis protein
MKAERRSVLIIDHDRDIAEIVRAVLQDEGYDVAVLFDVGADAISAAIGMHEPDAVLLDGESRLIGYGSSWAEAAALSQRKRRVPVIMFTANVVDLAEARLAETDRSRMADFVAILSKPFDVDELVATVAKTVGQVVPFDRSTAADAGRSAELAAELERIGAQDVRPSGRREWVTFRTPAGRIMQIYWWQTGGSYLIGRYDPDGRRMENIALTYSRAAAVEMCAALLRGEAFGKEEQEL